MIEFYINAISLGVGLAMDAFSVSLANGFYYPELKSSKKIQIAGTFGIFQFAMPLIGWFCVHTILQLFKSLQFIIPWIAFFLLGYIGIKMILEGIKNESSEKNESINFKALIIQGIATSIDALSVGFTIADYGLLDALIESIIIGIVTFGICFVGLYIGNKVGNKFQNKAIIFGGIILIIIGSEILIESFL